MTEQFATWVFTTMSAGVAAYFGAYLKQKGQNVATHEDMQRLVAQMEATTTATKAIEGRISDEFWNKQRVWEMKRDTLLGLLACSRTMQEVIPFINGRVEGIEGYPEGSPERSELMGMQSQDKRKWGDAFNEFVRRRTEVSILCSPEVFYAANSLGGKIAEFFKLAKVGKIVDFVALGNAVRAAEQPLNTAIQKELGVTPQPQDDASC
jgi:hypothetical protein